MTLTKQIDPTNGLIAYIKAIKPYHSKVLDVLVEYVAMDKVEVRILDKMSIEIKQTMDADGKSPTYLCGYGNVWDPYGQLDPATLPRVAVLGVSGYPNNEVLVQYTPPPPQAVVVSGIKSNQLMMVDPCKILNVNPPYRRWVVEGDVSDRVTVGERFFVSSNEQYVNGAYTVANISVECVEYSSSNPTVCTKSRSTITTIEPISMLARAEGFVNVPTHSDNRVLWSATLGVRLKSTEYTPSPINSDTVHYFNPSPALGTFNLLHTHIPRDYEDYVDVTNLGSGELVLERAEPFVVGDYIEVEVRGVVLRMSVSNISPTEIPGQYLIKTNERINEHFEPTDKPIGSAGIFGTYGGPTCPPADVPPTYAVTSITERLTFQFTDSPEPIVIL